MKILSIKKGFTIVETLVAISIMMIAIAGPLTVANKGYTSALDARNQSEGSFLAQEVLEYLNYIKDNGTVNVFKTENNTCNILILDFPTTNFTCNYFLQLPTTITDNNQVLATVVVSWNTGLIGNSVTMQELLTNYVR